MNAQTTECPSISLANSSTLPENYTREHCSNIPAVRFYSDRIVLCQKSNIRRVKDHVADNSIKNLRLNKVKGVMSRKSFLHARKHLTAWMKSIEHYNESKVSDFKKKDHKIVMITLTLPAAQVHTDKYLKRELFSRFIDKMKYHYNIDLYFIRYELQKNMNIHGHLLIDTYVDFKKIQRLWNSLLDKLGYIDRFEKKHGHRQPPSTHVAGAHNTQNVIDYVLKYCLKKTEAGGVEGRQYGMSESLLNIDVFETEMDYELTECINSLIDQESTWTVKDDYFSILFVNVKEKAYKLPDRLLAQINNYYINIYNHLYNNADHPNAFEARYQGIDVAKDLDLLIDHSNNLDNVNEKEPPLQLVLPF